MSVGVADVLLISALAYRLTIGASPRRRRVVTGVIAALAALDPLLTRYDRQDVIEPFALCVSLLTLHAAWHLRDRGALGYVSVTGVLGGLALLTNEITVCLIAVPPLFALLDRNGPLVRRSAAALGIAVAFLGLFLLWSAQLGLAGSFVDIQTTTLRRLVGLVQLTGLNMPGVSLGGALLRSVDDYSSTYVMLTAGFAALVWCWSRTNSAGGNFLTAWLTASYAFGGYLVAVGTLNEQFFVYLLPAGIVGSVCSRTHCWPAGQPDRKPPDGPPPPSRPGFAAAAGDGRGRPGRPGGPGRVQLVHQLQQRQRRRGAHRPVHRGQAAGLRGDQCQRRSGEVLVPAGRPRLLGLRGGARRAG